MSMKLGIKTHGLSKEQIEDLQKSVAGAIKVNENERKMEQAHARSSYEIQRRGQSYPGDTGSNFGLGLTNHGNLGLGGPFDQTYPGSYFFSGFFGGDGHGTGFGNYGYTGHVGGYAGLGQGSHTAFKRNTQVAHRKMALCVSAYKGFGLAKNVIDLMANFASEGLKIKHPNKTIERFLNRWAFHVGLNVVVKNILRYYYKYGNVFTYRTLGEIDDNTYTKLKRSRAKTSNGLPGFRPVFSAIDPVDNPQQSERIEDAQKESKKPVGKRQIPWRYTLLNPFQMELRGTKFFGGQRWVFVLDTQTVSEIHRNMLRTKNTYVDFLDESDINLPPEFKKTSKELSKDAPDSENPDPRVVELDQTKLYTMHYMKDDHEDWAEPLLWPVMADIFYKNKLRQMDLSVCDSVINAVTIFKLGNIKEGYIASEAHMSKFAELLRTPTQAMNMVWNDAIAIESNYPPVEKILGIGKYESVDRDILRGIGIPDSLIGGAAKGNFATGFLGVRTLLERLEEGRETVIRWLMKELQLLVETLGIRKMPSIRFGKMSLRDEKAEKQLIIQLLDRNIISIEAVLEAFGEEFELELERLKDEDRIREQTGLLQKHSPYVDPINDMTTEEQMKKESEQKLKEQRMMQKFKQQEQKGQQDKAKPNSKGDPGRPVNTGTPQEKKRETKPQGMAWILEYEKAKALAVPHVSAVEKIVAKCVLKSLGKKNLRSLTKHEAKGIEEITFAVASQTFGGANVTKNKVLSILANNPIIKGTVHQLYQDLLVPEMCKQNRMVAMASAIALDKVQGE
jgi:hypothetical protein